jgi:beta-lactamase superfamily II metal-dependent hydrolase
MQPARTRWWTHCIKSDIASYYQDEGSAETEGSRGLLGQFIWGDRIRVIEGEATDRAVRIAGRGIEAWLNTRHLGDESLLELYVIDVGQGDGLLLVTPEGHHIMVDGGNLRRVQNGGKNAADFVDWKFARDYPGRAERADGVTLHLDAMIASHCDQDHFGGLLDLVDLDDLRNATELNCEAVTVEHFYHAGLSWWFKSRRGDRVERTLGEPRDGAYVQLLQDRASAEAAVARFDDPDTNTLNGGWGSLIRSIVASRRKDGVTPTSISRLSHKSAYLPDFAPGESSVASIRVLGPVEIERDGAPALQRYPDGDSKNTNGHSVVLRVDYGDRRLLLTGDLNTSSQHQLMETFGDDFAAEFGCDVAKGCHHGSHDVSLRFLAGLTPIATVISSGDAETHDHPRPNILSASVMTSRKLVTPDGDRVVAPLLYATEIARSVQLGQVQAIREFDPPTPKYLAQKPAGAIRSFDNEAEMSRFRIYMSEAARSPQDWPRLDSAKVVRGLTYGLVNVRTDGKRVLFAVREESGTDWAIEVLEEAEIEAAAV